MTEAARLMLLYPNYADVGARFTPTPSGGSWVVGLPLTNLATRHLWKVARSSSAAIADTRFHTDLLQDAPVRGVVVPKHTGSAAARFRALGVPSSMLLDYESGNDLVVKGATASRGSVATYTDANGVTRAVASGATRDGNFSSLAVRSTLLEDTRTNAAIRKRDLSNAAWTKTSMTAVRDQVGIDGAANTATRLTATGANATVLQAITLGSSARFQTAFVKRFAGSGTVQMTMDNGATWTTLALTGTLTRVSIPTQTLANPTVGFRIVTSGDAIVVDWVQNENGTFATSPIGSLTDNAASETRSVDSVYLPYPAVPQTLTLYLKFVQGAPISNASVVAYIGNAAISGPRLWIESSGSFYRINHNNGSATVLSTLSAAANAGDTVELTGVLNGDGSVFIRQIINGGAETTSTTSGTNALAGAWSDVRFYLNAPGSGAGTGYNAYVAARIVAGVQPTALLQAIVYDSGWLTPYPAGKTADDLVGMNIPMVALVPSTQTPARYWSVQIDDTANAAGYIDVSRLLVSGAYQPSVNYAPGAAIALESDTQRTVTEGGAASYLPKKQRRTMQFSLDSLSAAEVLDSSWNMQRIIGLDGQVYVINDPSDPTRFYQTSFLAVLKELGTFGFVIASRMTPTFKLIEEL